MSRSSSNRYDMPLKEAAKLFPSHPHVSTLHRWALDGFKGIRLKTVRSGRQRFTSREAVEQFIELISQTADSRLRADGC